MSARLKAPATLLWLERGRRATRDLFAMKSVGPVKYPNTESAISEAMRVLTRPNYDKLPWILSEGTILDPDDVRVAHGRIGDHLHCVIRYAA
jgi:hypothetical protein